MPKVKVLISDKLSPAAIEIFKNRGVEVDLKTGLTEAQLIEIIGEYDGLAIRSATKVTPAVLAAATKLKVVGRAGIGVDNVDVKAATARGVVVMNTPFGNSVTTAEHAITLMMSLARDIPAASASTHAGKWEKNKFMGVEMAGKTLGLIGCGNIGSIVADRAQGLKMKVISYDPFLSAERAAALNVEKVELEQLLARADFISLHTPLTDATRHLLGKENLAKTKKGVRIINCARGGLIVEADLKAAIESGHVAGAALDVFEEEPAKSNPLFGMEQVIATPHLGASTSEAQENVAIQVAEQMAEYLTVGTVTNALNMPSVSAEDAARLKPYLDLATRLGSFAGQMTKGGITNVTIEYEGKVTELNIKPLTAAALNGLLSPLMEGVNMVNAPVVAKDRNIEVSEIRHDRTAHYKTLMRITVAFDGGHFAISGTLFGDKPRVVALDDVLLEASLGNRMLYVANEDKPGLIGGVGQLLGDAKINIANFHLGRNVSATYAVALIEVDDAVDAALLAKIEKLPNVQDARMLQF
ncbi:MAG: phosphoglycerate dehydrogenase [Alphaproteobacteria bacterium]|nr:phosphoglycerate dehydrogenase [Alphaproteobacteria bacterium]